MNLNQLLDVWKTSPRYRENIVHWQTVEAVEGEYAPLPAELDPRLAGALRRQGLERLYSHQAAAFASVAAGRNTVVVTPTASGKTLCYTLPVVDAILRDEATRALYLFPTKALAQDQAATLHRLVTDLGVDIKSHTYDGDTPASARKLIRTAGHVVITNPDMLHSGILPHHTKWVRLFESLKYVVIDELHGYRGVFGSHVANVIRRLRRVCRFYGSDPTFIFTSATIANPLDLARRHLGDGELVLVDDDGSPRGEKVVAILNPPVVNAALGIRASSLLFARDLAGQFLTAGIQTIAFTRSRMSAELLLTYLRAHFPQPQYPPDMVRGYRGGYLPKERRSIERGLRD